MPSDPHHPSDRPPPRRRYPHLGRRRSEQDDLAHAEDSTSHDDIPEHPLIPREAPAIVQTPAEFEALLQHLRGEGLFAYDTEFIGEQSYFPKLCLIQVATTKRVVLIDALAGIDLRPFWELMADPTVEKVLHAGAQDLEPVVRHLERGATNVIDTQIAAGLAGMTYPKSLASLVHELLGKELGKGLKFSQWDRRPLSPVQIRYAGNDVRYLPALRTALRERIEQCGNTARAQEEFESLCEPGQYRFNVAAALRRVRGAAGMRPRLLAVMRALVVWRDGRARALDVPPRTFLADEVMVGLVRTAPQAAEELSQVRGLPRPVREAHGPELIQIMHEALAEPRDQRPQPTSYEESPTTEAAIDALWAQMQADCIALRVDPALFGSRRELARVFFEVRRGRAAPHEPMLTGWRGQLAVAAIRAAGGV